MSLIEQEKIAWNNIKQKIESKIGSLPYTPIATSADVCPLCGGVGFVVPNLPTNHPGFGRVVPCDCRKSLTEQHKNQQLQKLSALEGKLAQHNFDNFNPTGKMNGTPEGKKLNWAYQIAFAYAENPAKKWLILRGGYGCGKTHLAAAIANKQLEQGRGVIFVNVPDLLDDLRKSYQAHSAMSYEERFTAIRTAPFLVLDDFGAHRASDWAQEKIYQLINYRYNEQLPTVITMNIGLEEIEGRVRSRLVDTKLSRLIHITAPDYRQGSADAYADLSILKYLERYRFKTFQDRHHELLAKPYNQLKTIVTTLQAYSDAPKGWIVLSSTTPYNGKTHLAAAVAHQVKENGNSVLFLSVSELLDHLRATFDPKMGVRLDIRFQQIKDVSLLVLDNLGMESATPWAREKMHQLFNHRFLLRLPTLITTNLMQENVEPRLRARFSDPTVCQFLSLETIPSYRATVQPQSYNDYN